MAIAYESNAWAQVKEGWRQLYGSFAREGVSVENHEFEAVAPGCCNWGLYVDALNHLFLRNDPLVKDASGALVANPRFVRTLTHEISHVLSSRLGVWDIVGYDRRRDEDLAEAFVAYMGMHFPAESSAEDLAYHRGRIPRAISEATPPAKAEPALPTASANTSPQR